MNTGLNPSLRLRASRLHHRVGDVGVRVRPGVDDFVVALAVRDVAGLVRLLEALDALLASSSSVSFSVGNVEVFDSDRDAAARGVAEAELLQAVEERAPCPRVRRGDSDSNTSSPKRLLLHVAVLEAELLRDDRVEHHATGRRRLPSARRLVVLHEELDRRVERHAILRQRHLDFGDVA